MLYLTGRGFELINILLVDDHELVRTGIRRILGEIRGINVIGEANSGEEAVKWCRKQPMDIVLMDINMPGIGGIEAARKILRYSPEIRIIILTMHTENPLPTKIMQAGMSGYLSKAISPQEMVHAIRTVHLGQRYIEPAIAQQIALDQLSSDNNSNRLDQLSERELQVMLMLTQGQKAVDIAHQLNLSPKTINSYRYRMFQKLNVHSDVELTHLAIQHHLINPRPLPT